MSPINSTKQKKADNHKERKEKEKKLEFISLLLIYTEQMHFIKKTIFFLLIFPIFLCSSNEQAITKHPGCPPNSYCSKKLGIKYKKWPKTLKRFHKHKQRIKIINDFKRKNGIPIGIWATEKSTKNKQLIRWESPCPKHQQPENKIYIGTFFANHINQIKGDGIITEPCYLLSSKNKIQKYTIPRGERPVSINGNRLIFIQEAEENYYGLSISPNGNLQVIPIIKSTSALREVTCPKELLKFHRKNQNENNNKIYQEVFCKEFKNIKTGRIEIILFMWSC